MVFMIQKEVAEKFDYNLPKMNKYKFLTKVVSSYTNYFNVSPKVFIPKPKVHSSVVKFILHNKKINFYKADLFSKLIFKNVRKKIDNNIKIIKKSSLTSKRVNQLSIEELFIIYNLF